MILDLVIIAIITIAAVLGAKLGFIRTVYQVVSSILALVLAFVAYPIVQAALELTPLHEGVRGWIANKIPDLGQFTHLQQQAEAIKAATEWLPDFIGEYLIRNNNTEVYQIMSVQTLEDYLIMYLTNFCMIILAILITWVAIKIGLSILITALDIVSKLPVLRTVNEVVGFVAGAIKGLLIVWLMQASMPLLILIPQLSGLEKIAEKGMLNHLLYECSIILHYINNVIFK